MAERLIFHYHDRNTVVHRLDPRIKMFCILALTILLCNLKSMSLMFLLPYLLLGGIAARIPVGSYRKESLFFGVFALIIFLTHWWGSDTIIEALIAAARFLTIVAASMLLTDTTSPEDMSLALFWIIRPFSKRHAYNLSAKFNLTVNFIPMLFDASQEIHEARRSRLEDTRRHPVRRMVSIGTQLMDLILVRAEEISYALESRCFTPEVLHGELSWRLRDTAVLVVSLAYFCFTIMMTNLY